jgi:hypothetical protein
MIQQRGTTINAEIAERAETLDAAPRRDCVELMAIRFVHRCYPFVAANSAGFALYVGLGTGTVQQSTLIRRERPRLQQPRVD